MKIFDKYLDDWDKEDVDRLKDSEVPESKTIEYKRELNLDSLKKSENKKKFLFNIAAFANTDGGVIFFGIDEKLYGKNTGIPTEICPIEIKNNDKCEQIIADIIGNNFDPSYSQFKIHFISYDDKYIIALELQKALGMPRMVTFNGTNKFYKRRNTGKYLVDTFELKNMFSEAIQNRKAAEEWRVNRVRKVRNKEFIQNLDIQGSLFLHILPIQSEHEFLDLTNQIKLTQLKELFKNRFYEADSGYNLEGYLIEDSYFPDVSKVLVENYFQLFRYGLLEFYSKRFRVGRMSQEYDQNFIDANSFEKDIINYINISLKIFELYELDFPFVILVTQYDLKDISLLNS